MLKVKLDAAKLLGFRVLAAEDVADSLKLGDKVGEKIGVKEGTKDVLAR